MRSDWWQRVRREGIAKQLALWWQERVHHGPASLANRLLLLQISWALLVGILLIASLWWGATQVIADSFHRQGEGWINKLDELGTPLYSSTEGEHFNDTIAYLKNFPEISSVQYFDESGRKVIAEYLRAGGADEGGKFAFTENELKRLSAIDGESKPLLFSASDDKSVFHLSAPIWIKSLRRDGLFAFSLDEPAKEDVKLIGMVRVGLDYTPYQRELEANILIGSGLIVLLLVFAALVGRRLIHWALNPLAKLEEPLNRLAHGETDVQVESSGDQEIAKIGLVLNSTISALRERDEMLPRMANHDPLTGLANRSHFTELLDAELHHLRYEESSSALFFIDLDRFKFINDTYGHGAGDRLLKEVAALLKHRMREGDVIGRFGGDEFTALVRNVDQHQAKEVATSLLNIMRGFQFHEGAETLRIYFSIGISVFDATLPSSHDVILQADAALHEAKSRGRNRYHLYEGSDSPMLGEAMSGWHERISHMLDEESMALFYQPLYPLQADGERVCEMLMRMPDVEHGFLSPAAFFTAAERFGLMARLDRQVIFKAATWLLQLEDSEMVASINLSHQSFEEEGVADYLPALLQQLELPPQRLIFEVSEQDAIRYSDKVEPVMASLSALGCRFAIDDFGTGFAALQYLKHTPVQWLKIDGTLIEGMAETPLDRITVQAIVDSARQMKKRTVAKFVGDVATLQILMQMGVDYAQGNFLAEAQPTRGVTRPALPRGQ